jgi:hypothetical protein
MELETLAAVIVDAVPEETLKRLAVLDIVHAMVFNTQIDLERRIEECTDPTDMLEVYRKIREQIAICVAASDERRAIERECKRLVEEHTAV